MVKELHKGDKVGWEPSGDHSTAGGQEIDRADDDQGPQGGCVEGQSRILVETGEGKRAAHKSDALTKA